MLARGFCALKRLESSMLEIIPSSNMVAVVVLVEEVVTYGSAFLHFAPLIYNGMCVAINNISGS